jgi:hypothetical protein
MYSTIVDYASLGVMLVSVLLFFQAAFFISPEEEDELLTTDEMLDRDLMQPTLKTIREFFYYLVSIYWIYSLDSRALMHSQTIGAAILYLVCLIGILFAARAAGKWLAKTVRGNKRSKL